MPTFDVGKPIKDIEEKGELLPDDWYRCRIVKQPLLKPNAKKRQKLTEEEGARDNIVVNLRVIHENPKWSGRPFIKYLPVGNAYDFTEERIDEFSGTTWGDRFAAAIAHWSQAFGGTLKGSKASLDTGAEAMVYITQEYDNRAEEPGEDDLRNVISMNHVPTPIE